MKKYLILFFLLLTSCANQVKETSDSVILYKDGDFRKSEVIMYGVYCTAGWYKTLDHLYLKSNGTIDDGPFHYTWTLNEFNSEADKIWYAKTCKEL